MRQSFDFENFIGIDWFLSSTAGIGGKLRSVSDDFIVEEMGEPRPGEGVYALRIKHDNWESGALRERFCRDLGLREEDVTFAGTKDKRAVVVQWVTVRRRTAPVVDIEGVEVLEQRSTSCLLRSGEHDGNRFTIRIGGIESDSRETLALARATLEEMKGIWPNYFGIQRFGAYRPVTHLAGKALVEKGAEEAVKTYLGYVGNTTGEEREARMLLASGANWYDVLEAMPKHLVFEVRMLRRLADNPGDYRGALSALPRSLVRFLVHSYQSYLFNRVLSKRIEAGLSLLSPVEGDLIQPVSARLKGGRPRFIPVTSSNIGAIERSISRGKGWITAALPGNDTSLASGEPGEMEYRVMEENGLEICETGVMLSIPDAPEVTTRGTRRPISLCPGNMEIEWDNGLVSSFSLPPGGYATTVLREVMKSPDPLSY